MEREKIEEEKKSNVIGVKCHCICMDKVNPTVNKIGSSQSQITWEAGPP